MSRIRLAGLSLFLLSAAAIVRGIATGDVRLSLFVVFPVFTGTSPVAAASFLGMFAGIAVYFWGTTRERMGPRFAAGDKPRRAEEAVGTRVKSGGVVLLGPIPIVFGSDWRYATLAIALTIVLLLLAALWVLR